MDANQLADVLGVSPLYRQKENARWSSAVHLYQEMLSTSALASPDGTLSPKEGMARPDKLFTGPLAIRPNTSVGNFLTSPDQIGCSLPASRSGFLSSGRLTPPNSFRQLSWTMGGLGSRRGSNMSPAGESSQNSLELEAVAAVHELSNVVQLVAVSEMLPRTPELIFVNVTSMEGQAYCIELTVKGWRVTSMRHDCMNGDINHMSLHVRYFESIYALMDSISPGYREKFTEALSARLKQLQTKEQQQQSKTDVWNDAGLEELVHDPTAKLSNASDKKPQKEKENLAPPSLLPPPPPPAPSQQTLDTNPRVQVRHPSGEGVRQQFPTVLGSSPVSR